MDGYIKTKKDFDSDSVDYIVEYLKNLYPKAGFKQIESWRNLITDIKTSEKFREIPPEVVIAIEYSLPTNNMAIDLLIAGQNMSGSKFAFIIEAKQWGNNYIHKNFLARRSYKDNEEYHPQIQVSRYVLSFKDYLDYGYTYNIKPMVYIKHENSEIIKEIIAKNPNKKTKEIICTNSINEIMEIILKILNKPTKSILEELCGAYFKPSKDIIDAMKSILTNEESFILTEEQEKVIKQVKKELNQGKRFVRITGAAGSGKTAILLNLYLSYLTDEDANMIIKFLSGNQNTDLYKSLYPKIDSNFKFSFECATSYGKNLLPKTKRSIVFMDEAQHNSSGIITTLMKNEKTQLVLCYDEQQTISADNSIIELKELEKSKDFVTVELKDSLRFNGSIYAERNIKNILENGKILYEDDDKFKLKIFTDYKKFQDKIISTIKDNPDDTVAIAGLLCSDADKYTSNSIFYTKWGLGGECKWVPYVRNKKYLNDTDDIWLGTWWMPGLDFDYVGIVVGGDAKLTSEGLISIPEKAKLGKRLEYIIDKLNIPKEIIIRDGRGSIKDDDTFINLNEYLNNCQDKNLKAKFLIEHTKYVKNMYYIMLTRGRKGCFVYFANNDLT